MNAQLRTGSTSIHSVLVLPRRFHRQGGEKVGAAVQGHRLLRKPKVAAFIQREQKTRSERLRMDADEALETIIRHARGYPKAVQEQPTAPHQRLARRRGPLRAGDSQQKASNSRCFEHRESSPLDTTRLAEIATVPARRHARRWVSRVRN